MDDLKQRYQTLVERIRGYPMPEAARAIILAEIEEAYRRERDRLRPDDMGDDMAGKSMWG
jgi:hypothetical protein